MRNLCARFPASRLTVASVAVFFLVGASFLPGELKLRLHMRGPFHAWGHVYAFALVLLAFGPMLSNTGNRWRGAGCMVLLGLGIEFVQARQNWAAVEWADLFCDSSGVLAALLILSLGAARAEGESILAPAQPPMA